MQSHVLTTAITLALAGLAGPLALAQTTSVPPTPMSSPETTRPADPDLQNGKPRPPAADQTVPLRNPLNRNPARRNMAPASDPVAPPDPRDSSVRPARPPGYQDGRDSVLPTPGPSAPVPRLP
jgi:hypothetical protein